MDIEYNVFPWFISSLPDYLSLPEDTKNSALLDLSQYVADDYQQPSELTYNISHVVGPGANIVGLKTKDGRYIFNPSSDTLLTSEDLIFALGTPEDIRNLEGILKGKHIKVK